MKSEAVVKINKMGKVAYIFSMIAKVALIIGLVGVIIGMAVTIFIPRGLISVDIGGTADAKIDLSRFITAEEAMAIAESGELPTDSATLTIGDNDYSFISAEVVDRAIVSHFAFSGVNFTTKNLVQILAGALMAVIAALVLMINVTKLCKSFRDCDNPFEQNILDSMKKLTISLLVWLVLSNTAESIIKSAVKAKLDIVIGVDMTTVIVALVCIAVMYVFRYGAELQKQADETL